MLESLEILNIIRQVNNAYWKKNIKVFNSTLFLICILDTRLIKAKDNAKENI